MVYTDHNPLTFLRSLRCPSQRLMRWVLVLQGYDLDIRIRILYCPQCGNSSSVSPHTFKQFSNNLTIHNTQVNHFDTASAQTRRGELHGYEKLKA